MCDGHSDGHKYLLASPASPGYLHQMLKLIGNVLVMAVLTSTSTISHAQIFITDRAEGGRIGVYNYDGTVINASLITGIDLPRGLVSSGSNLFVALPNLGKVGLYSTSGTALAPSLISGLTQPFDVAVSGSSLFVANYGIGTVGKYGTDGSTVSASFISGLDSSVYSLAISGSFLFVSTRNETSGVGRVGKYNLSDGSTVDASFITGLNYAFGLSISGSSLFVTNQNSGTNTVGQYSVIDGATINGQIQESIRRTA